MKRLLLPLLMALFLGAACGGGDSTAQLSGTSWRLTATGANQPVPELRQPVILKFDAKALSVVTGCNSMGGDYTRAGDQLNVKVVSTLIGCPEPLATIEAALAEVLSQKPTLAVASNQLTLTAPSGRTLTFVKA